MRIISGKYRKKIILPPRNFKARPTTDIAKEAIFNVLENNMDITQTKVLDLFSGTGNISYEFASRGCLDITSIEKNFNHYSFIKKTVQELNLQSTIKPVKTNVFVYLKHVQDNFDIIFADPPYQLQGLQDIPKIVFENKFLKPDGWLIIEHSKETDFSRNPHYWQTKIYGKVNFSIFLNEE